MKIESKIALRYLKSKKRNSLISFLSITSVVGIMLGVATLIIVVSVMTGFTNNLKSKLLGANADIIVTRFDNRPIDNLDNLSKDIHSFGYIKDISPFILSQAVLTSESAVTGSVIRSIEPERERNVSKLYDFIIDGSADDLVASEGRTPPIILGRQLANTLSVIVGDNISLVMPYGTKGPLGVIPKSKRFKVVGIFDTGIHEYNSTMAYINLADGQKFFNMKDSVSGLSLSVKDGSNLDDVALEMTKELGYPFWVRNWLSMNVSLFSALELEKYAMFIVLTLIIIVASFNIVSMIAITVRDKRRDIAILKAVGASSYSIKKVFILQGLIVGMLGTFLGDILALVISIFLKNFKIISIPEEIYFSNTIPVEINFGIYLIVTFASVLITLIASIFPSHLASKMKVVDGLRNE